jgi:hypothetical protein
MWTRIVNEAQIKIDGYTIRVKRAEAGGRRMHTASVDGTALAVRDSNACDAVNALLRAARACNAPAELCRAIDEAEYAIPVANPQTGTVTGFFGLGWTMDEGYTDENN